MTAQLTYFSYLKGHRREAPRKVRDAADARIGVPCLPRPLAQAWGIGREARRKTLRKESIPRGVLAPTWT